MINLENKWYKSLEDGQPDYSVYDDDYYFCDLWSCWSIYSRKYLRAIHKLNLIQEAESIVDLGCGISITTASLKELYPSAKVYGTNIEGTKQFKFGKHMAEKYNFTIVPDISYIDTIDVVFASEYFEHIERPIEHLIEIITRLKPKQFILANAFNTRSLGHFLEYKNLDEIILQKDISKMFLAALKSHGYKK